MIHFTISYATTLKIEFFQELESQLKDKIQLHFPLHAFFIFFFKSELEGNQISAKIEVVSKKGITEDEAHILTTITKEVFEKLREKYRLQDLPITIWLAPPIPMKEVCWLNGEK